MGTIAPTYKGGFTSMTIHNNDIPNRGKTSLTGVQQYTMIIFNRTYSKVTITTTLPLNSKDIIFPLLSTLMVKSSLSALLL